MTLLLNVKVSAITWESFNNSPSCLGPEVICPLPLSAPLLLFIDVFDCFLVKKSSGSTDLIVIVAIVCSVVAVIFLLTVVACKLFTNSTRKLKEKNAQKDMELFTTFTTVRDRIRQDSMPNPLVEALAKLSPDQKPPQCRLDRMEYVKDLGQGQFGKVFQGQREGLALFL